MSREYWRGDERELGRGKLLRLRCLAAALSCLLRIWGASWRVGEEDRERLAGIRAASPHGSVIYIFWHNRMIMLAYTHRRRRIQVLRSSSEDGQLIAEVLLRFGYGAIAGSSSRGGAAGLRRLLSAARKGLNTAVTVDGPRGPRGRLKAGVLQLAALSGSPIVPVAVCARRCLVGRSWDRTLLPWPGSRLRIRYGEGIYVSSEELRANPAGLRRDIEARLRDFSDALDGEMGRSAIAPAPPEEDEEHA